jgi:uncharacterized protein YidB (DUF937 family)
MDLSDLLKMGASMIQNSSNESTSGISSDLITNALSSILGGNSENGEGGLDLSSIVSNLTNGDLGETVASWIGSGENAPIDSDKVTDLIGSDKVAEFADHLGIDLDTAKSELANVLPNLVDKATNEDESLASNLLEQVGGLDGLMNMAGKFFKS